MWNFIKQILAVFIALGLFFTFSIFLIIGIGAASSSKNVTIIDNNSVLQINLDKPLKEREEDNPLSELDLPFVNNNGGIGLIEIKKVIKSAKTDPKIKGIYLNVESIMGGSAAIEEIRNALIDFKTSKKFIYSYSETYSEAAYYLASVSDKIFLNPSGILEFNGISSKSFFIKGMLDKLELKPQIFRVGQYKSAVEPLILDKMSDANKEQTLSFISSINNHNLKQIAIARKTSFEKIKKISDSMLVHNPVDAIKYGIATDLAYYDEFQDELRAKLDIEENGKINFISYGKYKGSITDAENASTNKIAVIVAEGDIMSGKSTEETIGSDDMAEEIRKARLDKNIKAIVLRINSPGGSAMASDVMWREITLTAKSKPIIASMSDVAASGGYFMAMGCSKIVAQPNSITGSIGVFGILFNISDFLKNKLGITVDGVKTGLFSDVGTTSREPTPFEKKVIQKEVDDIYKDFITKAAEGRKMSVDSLKKLASGRVWSGVEAKGNGLVDELGGLEKAISIAAKNAKLGNDYKVEYFPANKSFLEKIMTDLQSGMSVYQLKQNLGPYFNIYNQVNKLQRMQGVQARLPFEIILQ